MDEPSLILDIKYSSHINPQKIIQFTENPLKFVGKKKLKGHYTFQSPTDSLFDICFSLSETVSKEYFNINIYYGHTDSYYKDIARESVKRQRKERDETGGRGDSPENDELDELQQLEVKMIKINDKIGMMLNEIDYTTQLGEIPPLFHDLILRTYISSIDI